MCDDGVIPTLRGAFEATGSPSWVMRTIQSQGLDRRHGFRLELVLGNDRIKHSFQATETVLAEGLADFIDTDWVSIARCRQQGLDFVGVFPYGRIMGGVVVPTSSDIDDLADLRGRRIGVVRALDKNWSVVRAVCLNRHGFDLQHSATVEEAGSKTALVAQLQSGQVDAAVLYWHLVPPLTVSGRFRQLCDVLDLLPELEPAAAPTTFFAFRDQFVADNPGLIQTFIAAYCDAVALMHADATLWPPMEAELLAALRAAWTRRISTGCSASDMSALGRLFDRLKAIGGEACVGVVAIPPGTFAPAFMS